MMAKSEPETEQLAEEAMLWIARLNAGTATAADHQAWQTWRQASALHEQAAVEAESLWADLSQLHVDAATGLVKPGRRQRSISRRAVLTGLGVVAVTGAAGGTAWRAGAFTRLFADHATPVATTSVIDLTDGSRVTLSARSAIDILSGSDLRGVSLLEGQAYFEVNPALPDPFRVEVDHVSLRAHGASFNVTRDLPDGRTEIAVVSDTVEVLAADTAPVWLHQGEMASLDGSGRISAISEQNIADAGAWRQGIYRASSRTLAEVVAAIAPWYGGSILIAGNGLHELRVDAVLDLKDPRGSLDALQGGLPIRVRHLANLLTVISLV